MEEKYTAAEYEKAWNDVMVKKMEANTMPFTATDVTAELTRPKIHPKIPMISKAGGSLWFAHGMPSEGSIVLIPEPVVRDIARRALTIHAQQPTRGMVAEEIEQSIAHYRQHGPEARDIDDENQKHFGVPLTKRQAE